MMAIRVGLRFGSPLLFLLTIGGMLHAQERFGALSGVVRDESGAVAPGATVLVVSRSTDRPVTVFTDRNGAYRVDDLEPGRYRIQVELPGFALAEPPDVMVLLGRTTMRDATLRPRSVTQTVTVTADAAPLIDTRTTTVAHHVTSEELALLPKGRSFQSVAATAPSVNAGVIEDGYQVNGASGAENAFTIDGVVTSSLFNGRSRQDTVFEYVQEVQVKTAGIAAEYGGAMGGVVSAVTKSGGNTTHGELHYYFDGSAIGATPVPRLVLSPFDDKTVSQVQDGKQPDRRNEFGGSLGAPIVRDRLFFFVSVSPRVVQRTNSYLYGNGVETGQIGQKLSSLQGFGKMTYASGRVRAYGSVLATPTTSTGTLPAYNGPLPNSISSSQAGNAANLARGFRTEQTSVTGNVDITLSGLSLLTVRAGYFSDNYQDVGVSTTTSVAYQTSSIGYADIPAELQGPVGTQNTPRAIITAFDRTTRAVVSADYQRSFAAGGRHLLKAGVGVQRTVADAQAAYPGGYVLLYWNRTFSFGGTSGRGIYGYYEVNDRGYGGKASAPMTSVYVQDEWAVNDRMTLNLGLRSETEKIPTYRPDVERYALTFSLADRIAPRLGLSYALADGRGKAYGSWGRFYDWTKGELARGAFGSDFWRTYYRGLDTLDVNSLSLAHMPGQDLWIVPNAYRDQAVPSFDRVDPATKPTFQDSTSAGFEHQLGAGTLLSVHYVHNDLKRVIEDVGSVVNGNTVAYITNPGEGSVRSMATTGLTRPFVAPRVKRIYDAIELGVNKRLSRRWFASANYTYSRLYGNYGGLASSDEIRTPTTGVGWKTQQAQAYSIANPGGSLCKNWNIDETMWDSRGHLDVVGRLATDRPHVVKLYGAYVLPVGTQIGLTFSGASGTPLTTYVNTTNQAEVFVNGRGDMGRTPAFLQTNLLVAHRIALDRRRTLQFDVNVLNLFNQQTATHVFNWLNRGAGAPRASSAINLTGVDLQAGYDYRALILASPDGANAFDPRYGRPDLFAEGRQAQVSVKLIF